MLTFFVTLVLNGELFKDYMRKGCVRHSHLFKLYDSEDFFHEFENLGIINGWCLFSRVAELFFLNLVK